MVCYDFNFIVIWNNFMDSLKGKQCAYFSSTACVNAGVNSSNVFTCKSGI